LQKASLSFYVILPPRMKDSARREIHFAGEFPAMKQTRTLILLLTVLSALHAFTPAAEGAEGKKPLAGIGIILGDPTGITGKVFLYKQYHAVDFGFGAPVWHGMYVYADYLFGFPNAIPQVPGLSVYIGAGLGLVFHDDDDHHYHHHHDDTHLDVRIPLGAEFMIPNVPVGIFLDLVPVLGVIPDVDFHFRGGVGARYYFQI
jgi:hypothetical protein